MNVEQRLFPKSIQEAILAQKEMSKRILLQDEVKNPKYIAGVDVSNNPFDPNKMIFAVVVILSYPSLEVVETATYAEKQEFPYISGLLGFREVPALVQAYQQLSIRPDLLLVDGHGISHPRKLGIASHLGVILDLPTIGVAKSILVGKPKSSLPQEINSMVPLVWKEKEIGILLRSKKSCLPLIISAGHKITLPTALNFVLSCFKGYKLPEPTRQAHLAANHFRKNSACVCTRK